MIRVSNLTVNYGSTRVLQGVNIDIKAGEIYGLIGPNGAGKTTMINALTGQHRQYKGKIQISGHDISLEGVKAKSTLGFVPDQPFFYETLTSSEFLEFIGQLYKIPANLTNKRIPIVLKALGLEKSINSRIFTFSFGMKKRLAISAAILHKPNILIMDEPTNGLDPVNILIFKKIIQTLNLGGCTIFLSSHILDVVENLCTRIGIISNGIIVNEGSAEELKEKYKSNTLEDIFLDEYGREIKEAIAEVEGM